MNYQLATIDPLAVVNESVGGYPSRIKRGDPDTWIMPPNHEYIPIDNTRPPYDERTQYLEKELTPEVYHWAVRDKTQEQIDEYDARKAIEEEEQQATDQIRAFYRDMKNGVGTNLERLERVEKCCAKMVRYGVYADPDLPNGASTTRTR